MRYVNSILLTYLPTYIIIIMVWTIARTTTAGSIIAKCLLLTQSKGADTAGVGLIEIFTTAL